MMDLSHPYRTVICRNCGHSHTFMVECSDRTCPKCQERRRYRILDRFKPIVMIMQHPYFITLTCVRKSLTVHAVRKLRKDFTKLRHRKWWNFYGGIYQIEIGSLDQLGMCNLHIHIIADSPGKRKDLDVFHTLRIEAIKRSELSTVWREITGDSFIVDAKRCHSAKNALKDYLTKHMAKRIGKRSQANMINAALSGTRLIQGFGTLAHVCMRFFEVTCPNCHAKDSYIADFDSPGPQNPPEPRPGASLMLDDKGVAR